MHSFTKFLAVISLFYFSSCNNTQEEKNETSDETPVKKEVDSTEPIESKNWIDIQKSVSLMNVNTTYDEIISSLGKPYDQYVTPSLKEETVLFYNVPGVKGAIFWIMVDTESKNFLYWSGETTEKIRVNQL